MYVGIIQVELRIPAPCSLKQRRAIVRSLKDRVRRRFQVAIAEIGILDDHEEVNLGIALVSNEGPHAEKRCRAVMEFIENNPEAEVVDIQMEVL